MNVKSMLCGVLAAATLGTGAIAAEANLSNFKPASGADGIVATEGARPWDSTTPFDFKFWFDYARNPVRRPGGGQDILDNRWGAWGVVDLHVLDPISLAIAIPYTLHEHGTLSLAPTKQTRSVGTGLGDIRITPRIGLLRQETSGINLAVQATIELPSSDPGLLTTWGQPVAEGLISIGHRFITVTPGTGLSVIGNVFGFTAPNRTLLTTNLGSGFGARIGAQYETGRNKAMPSRVFVEVEAKSMPRTAIDQGPTPAEFRLGASWCLGPGFALDLAAGTGTNTDPGAPSLRLVTGLGFGSNSCSAAAKELAMQKAAADKAKAEKAAADKAAADKAAADKLAADKAAAEQAAADKIAAEKAAADKLAADKAAAEKAAADKAAAEAAAKLDTDGDGVPDIEDNCPNEKGPASNYGCPVAIKQLVVVSAKGIEILQKIQFATNKALISPVSHKLLDQVAAVMKAHPDLKLVEVQGYTDSSGDAAKNTALSFARADAVVKYLVKKGVDLGRLRAKGFGPDQPIADNTTKAGREKNRRVEFRVVSQ